MKRKIMLFILVVVFTLNCASAASYIANTSGYLGPNRCNCTIDKSGGSDSQIIVFKNKSGHKVEHMTISNINIHTSKGSVAKASVSKNNTFDISYSYGYGNGSLYSANGKFIVISNNFGGFTKDLSF